MTEERPKAEHGMHWLVTEEDATVSPLYVAEGLKERTEHILAEELPQQMAHLLARLKEIAFPPT